MSIGWRIWPFPSIQFSRAAPVITAPIAKPIHASTTAEDHHLTACRCRNTSSQGPTVARLSIPGPLTLDPLFRYGALLLD